MPSYREDFIIEECPLTQRQISFGGSRPPSKKPLKGPLRVVRFCLLGILLPCILSVLVLYLRYRVYVEQLYPLAVSDMRMLDNRVSTTWCQSQKVKVNNVTTFNAFLLPGPPTIAVASKPVSMVRHLVLEDDTKEYWGFYLLRGSTVTISTCVRWPGASLIVIRGHKHLHECAYIGDNSSEELDELIESINEGAFSSDTNNPDKMKRHREEVEFHHPDHQNSTGTQHKLSDGLDVTSDITDNKDLKKILQQLYDKVNKDRAEKEQQKNDPHNHVHRGSTIAKGENLNITSDTGVNTNLHFAGENRRVNKGNHPVPRQNSEELVQEVLGKLEQLGDRGRNIWSKVNDKIKFKEQRQEIKHNGIDEEVVTMGGRKYAKPSVKFDDNIDGGRRRRRREIWMKTAQDLLEGDDEEENTATEEGFAADGIADHHAIINETTLNDKSNSEFWSSFSSSEEALLNCAGLILNLPLTPHRQCNKELTEEQVAGAYLANTITYKVPTNGYYFFVFNSENEIQPNYIRVRFNIEKTVYDVSQPVAQCTNTTQPCNLALRFLSNERVVLELPVRNDSTTSSSLVDDQWNSEYVVVSECEPRTSLYICLVISVPVLVILFAFQ